MKTVFGDDPEARPINYSKGHASPPGTGPPSETCGTCQFCITVRHHDKLYRKCGLMEQFWTHGPGTDIRRKDPACRDWEPIDNPDEEEECNAASVV